jgi:rfaE bifunctional protein nucleotidyltransferase chain/domain
MSKIVNSIRFIPALGLKGNIVHVHGCFDLCHVGHTIHLKQAKSLGDILIVTVTADQYVNKGNGRPIFNEYERIEMISALECVDYVAICDYPDASIPISIIRPSIFCKGSDYANNGIIDIERDAVKEYGGKVIFTTTRKYSTTEIINRIKNAC